MWLAYRKNLLDAMHESTLGICGIPIKNILPPRIVGNIGSVLRNRFPTKSMFCADVSNFGVSLHSDLTVFLSLLTFTPKSDPSPCPRNRLGPKGLLSEAYP